jgi:glycosyltransferase involved in cell wall biosynthesis
MRSEPLISIIVNNYNYDTFLPEAIESALGQSYPYVEVIVVDDGSADRSQSIITSYGDRVTPVFKKNGGQASACNAGFAKSHGDVVVLLDADDVLLPHAARSIAPLFSSEAVAKVHWPLVEILRDGRKTGNLVPSTALQDGDLRDRLIQEGPHGVVSPQTSGNAWARAFLERVLPMPEGAFRLLADAYLFTLAPLFGRVTAVQEPLSLYRVHGTNDYAGRAVTDRNTMNLAVYEHLCTALSKYLTATGVETDPAIWKDGNEHYSWMRSLDSAAKELAGLLPEGSSFILVDGGELCTEQTDVIPGRLAIPFTERDGQYWGPPGDDETAIRELERLRSCGAQYLVFVWSAFWWVSYYNRFQRHLRTNYPCLVENERLIAFDLGGQMRPAAASPSAL